MTIDDENSIYVGNIAYEATEVTIRSIFDNYGQIIAVRMFNDREVSGKCYCFVTFTNPRSAIDAIKDMDGRKVEGRIIRVNEVMSKGGRSNFGRDNFRPNNNRDLELDKGRDRDYGRVRDRSRDQNREWSGDRDQGKERGYDRGSDIDRTGERFIDRSRDRDRDQDMNIIKSEGDRAQADRDLRSGNKNKDETTWDQNSEWSRDRDQGKERGFDRARDIDRTREHFIDRERRHGQDRNMESIERDQTDRDQRSGNTYKDESSKLTNGSDFSERHSREHPSASSHGDHDQVAKQLDVSHQKIQELQKEVFRMEELVEERGGHVSKLQEKSQKLEDALASAKKLTSNRKKQLTKLHRCFLNMKEYGEKLKSSEDELQSLVGSTMNELDYHNGLDTDGLLANGNA